jgi:hypothetical protein
MPVNASRKIRVILSFFLASLLAVSVLPTLNAATPAPRPTPGSKSTPTPTPTFIPLSAVFADTNVPQIISISSSTETIDDQFVASVALDVRIRRNTITSINIGLAQKTTQGAYVDPIFQAPCTKLSNFSVNTLNSAGDSTALQSRAVDGDWYLEKYVLTNKTKIGTNQVPCVGQYLVTSMAFVNAARHTLNVVANLASTVPIQVPSSTSSSGATRVSPPQSSTAGRNNDTAIMTSNIWNSRIDVAPCTPGTNLLPTTTTQRVGSTTVPVITQPPILQTNRVACAPTITFDFTKPLITILDNSSAGGLSPIAAIGIGGGLPIFDYAAANQGSDIEKLKKEVEDLKKKNAKLASDLAKLKKSKVVNKKPTPRPSPTATRRSSGGSGQNQGQPNWSGTNTRTSSPSPSTK